MQINEEVTAQRIVYRVSRLEYRAKLISDGLLVSPNELKAIIQQEIQRSCSEIRSANIEQSSDVKWPKANDVGRYGDMSPDAYIRVGLDSDNDVYVSIGDANGSADLEFCNPGGGGGGHSARTRLALIELMRAIEADNADSPSRDWWGAQSNKTQVQG